MHDRCVAGNITDQRHTGMYACTVRPNMHIFWEAPELYLPCSVFVMYVCVRPVHTCSTVRTPGRIDQCMGLTGIYYCGTYVHSLLCILAAAAGRACPTPTAPARAPLAKPSRSPVPPASDARPSRCPPRGRTPRPCFAGGRGCQEGRAMSVAGWTRRPGSLAENPQPVSVRRRRLPCQASRSSPPLHPPLPLASYVGVR